MPQHITAKGTFTHGIVRHMAVTSVTETREGKCYIQECRLQEVSLCRKKNASPCKTINKKM